MNLSTISNNAGHFIKENSPTILTTLGVTGAIATSVLVFRASWRSAEAVTRENIRRVERDADLLTKKEIFVSSWRNYVPAAAMLVATGACIIGSRSIDSKRTAALVGAYSIAEAGFKEYKDKVVETIGTSQNDKIKAEVAQEKVSKDFGEGKSVVITGEGDQVCKDAWSGRYFNSSMEKVRKAQNDLNGEIINNMYASLNDFYDHIGLERVSSGDEIGWNSDNLLELDFSATLMPDGRACMVFSFDLDPFPQYDKVR